MKIFEMCFEAVVKLSRDYQKSHVEKSMKGKDEKMTRDSDDAFCFQDTYQSTVLLSSLPQREGKFSQKIFIKFALMVLTKSIFHENKQFFPCIISPLPLTLMTISAAVKEHSTCISYVLHGPYFFLAQHQMPASSVIIHGQCKELRAYKRGDGDPGASESWGHLDLLK